MKLYFEHGDALLDALRLMEDELSFTLSERAGAELIVTVTRTEADTLCVRYDGNAAEISYGAVGVGAGTVRFLRGLSLLLARIRRGERTVTIRETPLFRTNGAMVDMSRNAVMKPDYVKTMLRMMARMGMNTYMLYTEDTYEIENRPYFGHLRGRYTKEELKELDAYAQVLGIELIPCIQMLGHLATHLRWGAAYAYKDTQNALLVGADETYRFLDDMLKTVKECFHSRRIHIGMDETHDLGTGASLDKNGYHERKALYFAHLTRVVEMVRAYELEPMMWSDMFFRLAGKDIPGYSDYDVRVQFTDEIMSLAPDGVQKVFWDYYRPNEDFYTQNIEKHETYLGKNTLFAGGIWCWSGHCPLFSRSKRNSVPALDACRKTGIREVIATVWHNGAECSLMLSVAGLAWYADYDYRGCFDEDGVRETLYAACGVDYDDFLACEAPEYPGGGEYPTTRAMLYNDPLIGNVDAHIKGLDTKPFYMCALARLETARADKGIFTPAFDVILALTDLLSDKADFGVRLKAAYDAQDRDALASLAAECDRMIEKLTVLKNAHYRAWMEYNKPFGWEVFDIRYGGLLARFATAKERILAYLGGTVAEIPELCAPRLRADCLSENAEPRFGGGFLWNQYATYATVNKL